MVETFGISGRYKVYRINVKKRRMNLSLLKFILLYFIIFRAKIMEANDATSY